MIEDCNDPGSLPERERRLKAFLMPQRDMLEILTRRIADHDVVCVPEVSGIPAGATVHHCFYDHWRENLYVVVSHPEFEIVPAGEELPVGNSCLSVRMVAVRVINSDKLVEMPIDRLRAIRDEINTVLFDRERA